MLRFDSKKFLFLELIGISGEFPVLQLNRLFPSLSYAQKVVTDLKKEKLIRTHYKDGLRGYRLTKRSKELLLSYNPERFRPFLTGNTETNIVRSEVFRRIRLHQKCETYLTLLHTGIPFYPDEKPSIFSKKQEVPSITKKALPIFYSSREIKELGTVTTKFKNSRSMGILLAPHCIYVIYNTGDTILKWDYKTEIRFNVFLQHYLSNYPYHKMLPIKAIMFGQDMDIAYKLLTSTGGYKRSLFMLDTAFQHFYFLPSDTHGETILKILSHPPIAEKLNSILLSDLDKQKYNLPIEYDALTPDGIPTILAYDFDMHRINQFNAGLSLHGLTGNLICFDFQIPILKQYMSTDMQYSSIDFSKFRKGFFIDP